MKKERRVTGRLELIAQHTKRHGTNHELVLRVLLSAEAPMTAYEILRALRRYGIMGPPTVYRALNRLMGSGHVHRLESINAYLACANQHHNHGLAVFAICRNCRHVDELAEGALARHLQNNAKRNGFYVEATTIELTGQCVSCAKDRLAK
jgi:Fur family transcriptional regulator, zinc uptake regulator